MVFWSHHQETAYYVGKYLKNGGPYFGKRFQGKRSD